MKNLTIHKVNVPNSIEEDTNRDRTVWVNGKLVEFDEGSHIIYYIDHQTDYTVDTNGGESMITLAYPIRVEKPVSNEKIIISALKNTYCLINEADFNNFQLKLLQTSDSEEVKEYREFVSWITDGLNISKGVTLEEAKRIVIENINKYDTSEEVNSFLLNNIPAWLDKNTRVGLINSITIEKAAGYESTNLWLGTQNFTLPIDLAIEFLNHLELYAKDCYNKTAEHKYNVEQLLTVEEVLEYDYKVGYPDKLSVSI